MRFVKKEVGYLDGIMVLLLAIAGNLGVQLLAGIIVGAGQTSNYAQLVCMIIFQLVFAAVPVIYYSAKKIRPALAFPVNKPRPSLALAPLLPVISMFGFMLPALLFETLLLNNGYKPSGLEFSGAGETALAAIATIILAPCAEELIFRGFLLSGLKKEFNTYVAALMSALAFSLMHMNPEQTIYQFFLSYVCALAAIKSGTLLAPIIVHAGSNALAMFADGAIMKFVQAVTRNAVSAVLCTVGLFIAAAAAVWGVCMLMELINRKCKKENKENKKDADEHANAENADSEKEKKSGTRKTGLMLYVGSLGICAVMWIFVFVAAML